MSWRTPASRIRCDRSSSKPELARHHLAELADGLAVAGRARVALVERLGEAEHRREMGLGLDAATPGHRAEDAGHLRAVDHRSVPAECLGGVKRLVAVRSRPARSATCSGKLGHPGRRGRLHLAACRRSLRICLEHLLREQEGAVLIHLRQHHRELLASRARDDVHQAGGLLEHARDRRSRLVAGRDPVTLVDPLEPVEVEHEHADRPTVGARALELALDGLVQRNAVRQAGQGVGSGRIGQPAQQPLDSGAQIGEQGRCGDQRAGGDHEVADRRRARPRRRRSA